MTSQWKILALTSAAGAAVAVAIVFTAAALGFFPPPSDKQFHDYLMANPSIVFAMSQKAQNDALDSDERKMQAGIDKVGMKTFFDPKVSFSTGPADAKNTFVEFFDYNCAHCRNSFPLVRKYYNAHKGDTRFAFVEFPIFGQASDNAARAALAARNQPDKYLAFHFALMAEQGAIGTDQMLDAAKKAGINIAKLTADLKDPSIDRQRAAARKLASEINVSGTPLFIINGKVHSGEIDNDTLKDMTRG